MTGTRLHRSETAINGCFVVQTPVHQDERGFFMEAYRERDFREIGLPISWAQENMSGSKIGVLRGLHIQRKNPQGKLVRCAYGALYDVCLDLRPESPSFLKWHAEVLTGGKSLYCPPGTAHGFLALVPDSVVYYKCTSLYDPETDGGVHALEGLEDPIPWPMQGLGVAGPLMSAKDKSLPTVTEWLAAPRRTWNE